MPALIYLYVDDCDATYQRALDARADLGEGARRPVLRRPQRRGSRLGRQPLGNRHTRRGCDRGRSREAPRGDMAAGRPPERQESTCDSVKRAKLDPSQVEDYRGQGGGLGGLGGGKVLGGGGGVVGIVVLVLYLVLASQGGGLGELGSLAGQTVGPGDAEHRARDRVPHGRGRERARGLPHRRRRQQRAGVLGENASQLRAGADAVLRRADLDRLRRRVERRRPLLLPGRRLCLHRPRLLRPDEVAARRGGRPAGRGVRARARVRASRPGPHRRAAQRQPRHRPAGRPGAGRAPGRLLRRALGRSRCSTRGSSRTSPARTSTRRSTRRPPSATTASRSAPRGA